MEIGTTALMAYGTKGVDANGTDDKSIGLGGRPRATLAQAHDRSPGRGYAPVLGADRGGW